MKHNRSPIDNPLGKAWKQYLKLGWEPLPLPQRAKFPPPSGTTGYGGEALTPEQLADADPSGNVAIRLPRGVIGIDIDAYGGKSGDKTLAEAARRWGELPEGPWSSSRPDTPSRIVYFRVPEGTRLVDQIQFAALGLGGVEVIQYHHRYAVVWPSIHPSTGDVYVWSGGEIPAAEDLPALPAKWVRGLDAGRAEKVDGASAEDVQRVLDRIEDGEPCARALELSQRYLEQLAESSNHHGDALKAVLSLLRCGEEGHPGIPTVLAEYRDAFIAEVDRPERQAVAEFDRMVNGPRGLALLAAKPTPRPGCYCTESPVPAPVEDGYALTLPDEFWSARPVLRHIQQAAYASGDSADVVLGSVLARLSAMVPHTMHIRNRKGTAPLNLFTINLSESGGGKSSGAKSAKSLLRIASHLRRADYRDGLPIGSGEGLAEQLMGMVVKEVAGDDEDDKPKKIRVKEQVRYNAFLTKDEGQELLKMGDRSGSTTGEAIRSAWTGEALGQANSQMETSRYVPDLNYSMGIVINFQYDTIGPLLAQAGGGTPQRFLYFSADDPNRPVEMFDAPEHPGMLDNPLDEVLDHPFAFEQSISYPAQIEAEIWRMAQTCGGLDSHKPLMLTKVSGLLALLDQRTKVSDEDWELAKTVWGVSCAVRDRAVRAVQSKDAKESQARLEAEAAKAVHIQDAIEVHANQKIDTAARWLAVKVEEWGGEVPKRRIKDSYGSRKKIAPLDEVLQYAADQGWIAYDEGQPVRLGAERPE